MSEISDSGLSHKAELIFQTSQLVHAQVKMMLDKSMIDGNAFAPQLSHNALLKVMNEAVDIMKG